MKKKMTIKVYHSFKEADEALFKDSMMMKAKERVEAVNSIRRRIFKLKGINANNKVVHHISYDKRIN